MYLLIAAAATGVLCLLLLLPTLGAFRERCRDFVSFLVAVVATFAGVFLALHFAAEQAQRSERERAIRMLEVAIQDVETAAADVGKFYMGIVDTSRTSYDLAAHASRSPLPFPDAFVAIMQNDAVLDQITPLSFAELIDTKREMAKVLHIINDETISNGAMKANVDVYGRMLRYTSTLLDGEIAFQQGLVTPGRLLEVQQGALMQMMGVTQATLERLVADTTTSGRLDWSKPPWTDK